MDEELDVVVTGLEVDQQKAEAGLMRVFGIEQQNARRVLRELPLVARRCASLEIAERYVAALRSIGARVELQPARRLGRSDAALEAPALPAPLPSAIAGLHQSAAVDRAADGAIARFRASEGLDSLERFEGINLINPDIPRAPAIPHDLARMPNAALPRFSDRPSWRVGDASLNPSAAGDSLGARPPHVDAQPPPAGSGMTIERGSFTPPAMNKSPSVRPGAVGLSPHAAAGSSEPRLSRAPRVLAPTRKPRGTLWLSGLALLAASAYAWSRMSGDSEARRVAAFREIGVEPGAHEPAPRFFEATEHELEGMNHSAARSLVEKLARAGAPDIRAVQIQRRPNAAAVAAALVVELPSDPNARRTVLGLLAGARGNRTQIEPDHGQHYSVLSLH